MTSTMNHWERTRAAVQGEAVDRPPISLWRHWPVEDDTPQGLAAATVRWQQEYDFDLVKFMPTGTYGVHDWGAETAHGSGPIGTRMITTFGVTAAEQWPRLRRLEVTSGYLGQQIEALRLAAEGLANSVPILQTIFSPLTTAYKLAGERVFADLRLRPDLLKAGLQMIAETTARFALASVRAGAHGVFFATQSATYRLLNEAEYREFGVHYDLMVFDAVRAETELNMLHVHGEDIMFDLLASYPVEMLNWHDRLTWPDLPEARARFGGLLVGGINEFRTLRKGPVAAIQAEIQDAIAQAGGRRLMLGPGCVIPTDTPAEHVRAAVEAVIGAST
jgi:uroporphyrinogen decarboxylase